MPGQFLPEDLSKGDPNTIGGYAAVHGRPAAFEGSDGMSYSVEVAFDESEDPARPIGAYFLFLRWRRIGEQGVEGHLETDFLATATTIAEARDMIGRLPLTEVRAHLEHLIAAARESANGRRWWDAMRDEEHGV